MNLSSRQRLLAIVAGSAIALLAGDKLVVGPLLKSWKDRSERLATLRQEVEEGRALQLRAASIRERWQTMRKATLASENSVAENQMLKAFDRWAQTSRAGISSLKPQWKRGTSPDYATLECRVDASGSLESLTRLLYELENARRVEREPLALKIEVMELSTRDDNGAQIQLGLQVSGLQLNPPPKR